MKTYIDYLERMIDGCDSIGGMEREKAIYQSVLKEYRMQLTISDIVGQSEQITCPRCNSTNCLLPDKENDAECKDCGFVWEG